MLRQVNRGQSTVDSSIKFNKLNFPVVDANVISDATGKPLMQPYTIKSIGRPRSRRIRRYRRSSTRP